MDSDTRTDTDNFTLWDVAAAMAVTAEHSNRAAGKARHGKPRLRSAPRWLVLCGALALLLFGGSYLPLFALPAGVVPAFRGYSLALGILLLTGGVVVWLGDPAYHAISRAMRRLTLVVWWIYAIFAFPFAGSAAAVALASIIDPHDAWNSGIMPQALALSMFCIVFPTMTTMLAAPLLATTRKPRLQQARASRTIWAFTLAALVTTMAGGAVSYLQFVAKKDQPNYDMIVLTATVGVGLVGAVIGWHRRNTDRLEHQRAAALDVLGRTLDSFDFEDDASATTRMLRELRRVLTPSPFRSQSIAAVPHTSSYEVTEMIKLMEWSVDPHGEIAIPDSVVLRAAEGRPHAELFSRVIASGETGVRLRSRDFIARCYARLLDNTDGAREAVLPS